MRFKAKHSFFEKVVHDVHNFKNILVTLATKHQLTMAYYFDGPSFSPPLHVEKLKVVKINTLNAVIKSEVQKKKTFPHNDMVSLASSVNFQGIHYKGGMVLSAGECSGLPEFHKIMHILVDCSKVFFLCQKLSAWYIEQYRCFEIVERTAFTVLEPEDLNDHYPLTAYMVGGKMLLVLKRFLLH